MSRRWRGSFVVMCLVAALASPRKASAQDQAAPAESLFEEARALIAEKKYPEACAKLSESEKLDPAVGTLLNLGDCYEKMGKIATAWSVFKDAAAMAHTAKQPSREKLAADRAALLQPKIPRMSIQAPKPTPGLEVRRDGVVVGSTEWSSEGPSAVPLDPGEHDVVAVAPGKKAWSTKVALAADGRSTAVLVPELETDELAERAPLKPASTGAAAIEVVNTHDRNVQRVIGLSVGAVGLVTLVISAPLGAIAISTNDAAKKECPTNVTCTPNGANDSTTAVRDGLVSTVLFGVGVGVVVGGAVVFLTAPAAIQKPVSALRFSPQVGPGSGGFLLSGSF